MNFRADSQNSKTLPRDGKRNSVFIGLLKAVWIVPAVAALIVVLYLVLGRIQFSETGHRFVASLAYSFFIGLPSAVLLSTLCFRYTERFPRLIIAMQALLLICTAAAGSFAASVFLQITGVIPKVGYTVEFWASFPFAVVITLLVGLSISSFETMRYKLQAATLELRTQQVEQERANKLLAEARLSSLESRIHPHFLFNTLNSIAALIPSDPQRAEDTVSKLASLLRFSLNAQQSGLVLLSQEIKIVRDYLAIEETRFGARLRFEIEIPTELEGMKVPPLALQSLVENSVKHVVSQSSKATTILIKGHRDSGRMLLEVSDDGPGFSLESISAEHGLGNLITRLELLFGSAGQLEVAREADRTVVRLYFPA